MAKTSATFTAYRDSKSGRFVPIGEARKRSATVTAERIPKPGKLSPKSRGTIGRIDKKYDKLLERLAKR